MIPHLNKGDKIASYCNNCIEFYNGACACCYRCDAWQNNLSTKECALSKEQLYNACIHFDALADPYTYYALNHLIDIRVFNGHNACINAVELLSL